MKALALLLAFASPAAAQLAISRGIQDAAVTTAKLGAGSVTTPKLASDAVTALKILTGAVTTTKLGDGAVTTAKLNADAVGTASIITGAVTTGKLGDGAVTTSKLDADAVTEAKIITGAVTTSKLGDGSVTTPKLASDAVTEAKIITGAVTTNKLGDGSVTAAKLLDNSVTAAKVAFDYAGSSSEGGAATTALALDADPSDCGANTFATTIAASGNLTCAAVAEAYISDGAVTTTKIGDGAVTTPKLGSGAVASGAILAGAVTTGKLGDGSVTTSKLGADLAMPGAVSIDGTTFQVDSANNRVGIGRTDPATLLDVEGAAQFGSGATKSTFTATGSLALDANATLRAGTTFYLDNGQITTRVTSMTFITSGSDPDGLRIVTTAGARAALVLQGGANNVGADLRFSKSDTNPLFQILTNNEAAGVVGDLEFWDGDSLLFELPANNSAGVSQIMNGSIRLWPRTKAQIDGITPGASGEILMCSNCTYVCVSTGTTLSGFGRVGAESTTGCGSGS